MTTFFFVFGNAQSSKLMISIFIWTIQVMEKIIGQIVKNFLVCKCKFLIQISLAFKKQKGVN